MKRPDIILIMSDQHNPHITGFDGNKIIRTPNLDSLAREGVSFSNMYCPSPLCVPSRSAFLTGQYPSDINVFNNASILSSAIPTFAHSLSAAGYETVLCGRMHFDGPDQFHGFEKRIYGDCNLFLTEETNGRYFCTCGQTKYAVQVSGSGQAGYEAFDRNVTQKACEFLKARTDEDRPLCMVVGYVLPHNPLIIDKELYEYYYDKLAEDNMPSLKAPENLHPAIRQWRKNRGVDDISPEHARRALAAYYGLVEKMDKNIGKVIQSAKAKQNSENTIMIYCSDHGDCAGENGLWWKSNYFEGSARVPLTISCPSVFEQDKDVKEVSSLIDLAATLIDLAETEKLPYSEGRSLRGFLEKGGNVENWKEEAYSEYSGAYGEKPSCMIRSGKWKLMYYSEFNSSLLFNMEEDPEELNDLAGKPEFAETVRDLEAKIKNRWNPDMVERGDARDLENRPFIGKCGRELNPCKIVYDKPEESDNSFDKTQIPDWEKIYMEAENNAKRANNNN